ARAADISISANRLALIYRRSGGRLPNGIALGERSLASYFPSACLSHAISPCHTAVIRVIRHPGSAANHPRGCVLALGNFDGLHRGHALLIRQARDLARAAGRPMAVLTFEPHPRSVLRPGSDPFRLTPFRVKERELAGHGVDLLFVQHF